MERQYFLAAWHDSVLAGIGSLANDGLIDVLYVSKDYQRLGIVKRLLDELETEAQRRGMRRLSSDVSITAKPFFEKHGYRSDRRRHIVVEGVKLDNYKMIKDLK